MELGTLLKEARMEKGLTLDDIQEQTKIRKKYLEAIENNNFDIIPGNVYVKVFIKGYARQVGLDYSFLIEEYEILKENSEADTSFNKDLLPDGEFKYQPIHNKKKPKFLKILLIIFILLFAAASSFFIYQYFFLPDSIDNAVNNMPNSSQYVVSEENDSNNKLPKGETSTSTAAEENSEDSSLNELNMVEPQRNQAESTDSSGENSTGTENPDQLDNNSSDFNEEVNSTEDTNNLEETNTVESEETIKNETLLTDKKTASDAEETAVNKENEETSVNSTDNTEQINSEEQQTADSEAADEISDFKIVIKSSDLAWVRIDIDGENTFSGLLEEGDVREFSPDESLYIKIGNGAAVTAEVDETEYGPWGGSGEIAEAEMKIEDGEIVVDNLRD